MLEKNAMVPKFLDLKDSRFRDLYGACDFVYQELHQHGSGTSVWHAPVTITKEEEQLWSSRVVATVLLIQRMLLLSCGFFV